MDIKEIREQARLTIDEELLAYGEWKKLSESERMSWRDYWLNAQITKYNNTEIQGKCWDCNGSGQIYYASDRIPLQDCSNCNGTGKITITVEQAIKKVMG